MKERQRRIIFVLFLVAIVGAGSLYDMVQTRINKPDVQSVSVSSPSDESSAIKALEKLPIKGRAPKTGYSRSQFSDGWAKSGNCDVRNFILQRDLTGVIVRSETDCTVMQGTLHDPYTQKTIQFARGTKSSDDVQIDHVIALSNAWQTGAQEITAKQRHDLANDPLNLLAVDGPTNQKKSDADAATWLPPNKEYRCQYVARQIAVKQKYTLWVTEPEAGAIKKVLETCPAQVLPTIN